MEALVTRYYKNADKTVSIILKSKEATFTRVCKDEIFAEFLRQFDFVEMRPIPVILSNIANEYVYNIKLDEDKCDKGVIESYYKSVIFR
jgi:hypothetical protein